MRASKTTPPLYLPIMNLAPSAHEPNPTPTCITEVLRKNKLPTQYQTQHRHHHPGQHRLPPPKNPTPVTPNAAPPPRHPERSIPLLPFRTQRPFPLSFPTQPPPSCHSEQPHSVILSEVPSSLAILSAAPSSSVIPNTAPFPLCHSERSAALPPVIPNTVRNLNSLHIHQSPISDSSLHSK